MFVGLKFPTRFLKKGKKLVVGTVAGLKEEVPHQQNEFVFDFDCCRKS